MRKHINFVNGWYGLGLFTLVLTTFSVGTFGREPWRGLIFGMLCVAWARVERMEQQYRDLAARHKKLLERFLVVLSRESGDDTGVPRP